VSVSTTIVLFCPILLSFLSKNVRRSHDGSHDQEASFADGWLMTIKMGSQKQPPSWRIVCLGLKQAPSCCSPLWIYSVTLVTNNELLFYSLPESTGTSQDARSKCTFSDYCVINNVYVQITRFFTIITISYLLFHLRWASGTQVMHSSHSCFITYLWCIFGVNGLLFKQLQFTFTRCKCNGSWSFITAIIPQLVQK